MERPGTRPCGSLHGMGTTMLCVILLMMFFTPQDALEISDCRISLGMQSGEIPDYALTASSSYDGDSVGPANARIRTETNGGAWCPGQPVSKDVYEYLQIDLGGLKVITLVETQGRFGNGQGQEFADQYLLEYQREDEGVWFRFRNRRGQEIFQGNTNTYIAELREVDPPIIARKLRFIPYSAHPKTVCLRVELFGCKWKDGTVWYNMHQGERRGTEVDLYDFTYDGKIKDEYLSGGLGQLTDGEVGHMNFRLDQKGFGIKGYEWVGWRNETHHHNPIEIMFKFDAVRNFTHIRLHMNNMFSKDVRVFKKAKAHFSIGGEYFQPDAVVYNYMRDGLIEYSRMVTIPLLHHIGQYIKLQLHFDSKWMMISEIQVESEYAVGNFTPEVSPTTTTSAPPKTTKNPNIVQVIDLVPEKDNSGKNSKKLPSYDAMPEEHESKGVGPTHKSHVTDTVPQKEGGNSKAEGMDHTKLNNTSNWGGSGSSGSKAGSNPSSTTVGVLDSSREKKSLDDEYIGIIIGALSALILLLFIVIAVIIIRQRRRKYNNNHRAMKIIEPKHVTLDLNDLQTNTLNDGTILSRDYAVPDVTKSSLMVPNIPPAPPAQPTAPPAYGHATMVAPSNGLYGHSSKAPGMVLPPPPRPVAGSHYAASDVVNIPNIQGVSGNNVYAVPNPDMLWTEDMSIIEFPRENLKFMEKLGEGQFGEVHLCEAQRITDFLGDDFLVNRTGSRSLLVAVKMLRRNADAPARLDFQKEVKVMAQLKDPNIVRVLGVCTRDDPLCVIVEYMKYGDLNQFLQNHVLENTLPKKKNQKQLSYGGIIYMATQIASGMKYLEGLNMVHRDLATRNCLVGNQYTIKISDFGMSRSLYSCDYYRIEGRAVLPIRWMAWESILLGKFSTKSDVWSFGVTLWEILTFAREQPFDDMTDEQVIENCGHYYRNDGLELHLPPPSGSPREIYDLMRECWNREDVHRPSFREIHMFLQRKNMGYDPKVDQAAMLGLSGLPVV